MYENNPYTILSRHNVANQEEAKANILGGETAIWSEQSSGGDIESKVRPQGTRQNRIKVWNFPQ